MMGTMDGSSLQQNVFLVTKKFVTKSQVFGHKGPLVTKLILSLKPRH